MEGFMSSNVRAVSLPSLRIMLELNMARLFPFAEIERPGSFSPTGIGPGWLHSASGTQLLPDIQCRTVYPESAGNCRHDVLCEILEDARKNQPLYKISCRTRSSDLGLTLLPTL